MDYPDEMMRLRWIAPLGSLMLPVSGCGSDVSRVLSSGDGTGTGGSSTTRSSDPHDDDGDDDDPPYCLAEGTIVDTPDGPRAIEALVVGAPVFSVDVESGRRVATIVTAIRSAERECLALIVDEQTRLLATPDHPIYRPASRTYAPAGDFATKESRDVLRTAGESFAVATVEHVETYVGVHRVFDITVESPHHNFVANGIVVHNKLDLVPPRDIPEPDPVCPPEEGAGFSFGIQGFPSISESVSTATCTVTERFSEDDAHELELTCPEPVSLSLTASTPIDLDIGDTVELSVGAYLPAWYNRYVAVHRDEELVLAVAQGHALPGEPDEHAPSATFWAPLEVTAEAAGCEATAPSNQCVVYEQRLGLRVALDDAETVVHDSGTASVGELVVTVEQAVDRAVACEDSPSRWFSLVVVRPPQ